VTSLAGRARRVNLVTATASAGAAAYATAVSCSS
jgi:hypothetical protein